MNRSRKQPELPAEAAEPEPVKNVAVDLTKRALAAGALSPADVVDEALTGNTVAQQALGTDGGVE